MKKIIFIFIIVLCFIGYRSEMKADSNETYTLLTKQQVPAGCSGAILMDYIFIVKDCLKEAIPDSLEFMRYNAFIADKESHLSRASYLYELYLEKETNVYNKVQFHILYGDLLIRNFKYFEAMRQYSKALLYKNNPELRDTQFLKLQYAQINTSLTDLFYLLSFFDIAIEDYLKIESEIAHIEDLQSQKILLNIYTKLVDIYVERKEFKNAKIYVEKLEKLSSSSSSIVYDAYYQLSYLHYRLYKEYYEPEGLVLSNVLERISEINKVKEMSTLDSDSLFKLKVIEALFNGFAKNFDYSKKILDNLEKKDGYDNYWFLLYRQKQVYQAYHVVENLQGNTYQALLYKFKEVESQEEMVLDQDKEVVLKLKKQIFDMQQELIQDKKKIDYLDKNKVLDGLSFDVSLYNLFSLLFMFIFVLQLSLFIYFVIKDFIKKQSLKTKYLYTQNPSWKKSYLIVREKQPKEYFSMVGIEIHNKEEYDNKLSESQRKNFDWLFEHFIKNNLRLGDIIMRHHNNKLFIMARGSPDEVYFLCARLKSILETNLHLTNHMFFGIQEITEGQSKALPFVVDKINEGIKNNISINK